MEIKKYFRVDSHLHIYTSWKDTLWEPGPRDLESFTKEFTSRGLDSATLTNFNDDRYENFMETAKTFPKDWDFKEYERGAIVNLPDGKNFYWLKSQEIPTEQGHVLFTGVRKNNHIKPYRNIEEVFLDADDLTIIIADHPLWVMPKGNPLGIGEENLIRYSSKFHAAELNGSSWLLARHANTNLEKLSKKINLPLIANSDAYGFTLPFIFGVAPFLDIGKTYTEFEIKDLHLGDIDSLLYSLKENIVKNKSKLHLRKNNPLTIFQHAFFTLGYSRLKKIGVNIKHHCDKKN